MLTPVVLEADYSVCLQLLLKYPAPDPEHGPHTFVDDAVYLRSHPDFPGGSTIIAKYTARSPATPGASVSSPTTAAARRGLENLRQRALRSGGTVPGGGVEQFIQGAAKSARAALERSEKLGINQAVREAMGELRRNMQTLNDARVAAPSRAPQGAEAVATMTLAAMDKRSKQLASLLNETVSDLKTLSASNLDDRVKSLQMIEVAAAKVQFVQIYLEDSTMEMPVPQTGMPAKADADEGTELDAKKTDARTGAAGKTDVKTDMKTEGKAAAAEKTDVPPAVPEKPTKTPVKPVVSAKTTPSAANKTSAPTASPKRSEPPSKTPVQPVPESTAPGAATTELADAAAPEKAPADATPSRPAMPAVPTRSTIAQSSFSWMLEPDESTPSATAAAAAGSKSPSLQAKKRVSNVNRERNAFLFGDGDDEAGSRGGGGGGGDPLAGSGIFGLESMSKKGK